MLRKPSPKPKQRTRPKKGEPVEIPVPDKRDVLRDLTKIAKGAPRQHLRADDPRKS